MLSKRSVVSVDLIAFSSADTSVLSSGSPICVYSTNINIITQVNLDHRLHDFDFRMPADSLDGREGDDSTNDSIICYFFFACPPAAEPDMWRLPPESIYLRRVSRVNDKVFTSMPRHTRK